MIQQKTRISCSRWEVDEKGFGNAVYQLNLFGKDLALIAFSDHLETSQRTDRVIASAWDTSFALFDGVPSISDIERLKTQLPFQEAGRYKNTELVLSRANKSVRMFELVAQSLSEGEQPPSELINEIGYLMRTTAVYGNGKFGIDDRKNHSDLSDFSVPFQLEMLTVYLIRGFSLDLVNHVAKARNPKKFVPLDKKIQRYLGIGNSIQYREDNITVSLRMVSVATGEVLLEVLSQKTIFSYGKSEDVFRFIEANTELVEVELGNARNESSTIALMKAIEGGVLEIVETGYEKGFWVLQNNNEGVELNDEE